MTLSFVIPTYNHWELTHLLLLDIYNNCTKVDEVLVVDNGSDDEVQPTNLGWWLKHEMLPLRVETLEQNVGFIVASNIGLKQATGDVVALISNDVRIHNDIGKELAILEEKVLVGGRVYTDTTGWNDFDGLIFPYVEGWILATRNWKELDYLDNRFAPNDYEDIDLSTKAVLLGYDLRELPFGMVEHLGAQTIQYGAERQKITETNREKFRSKWIK